MSLQGLITCFACCLNIEGGSSSYGGGGVIPRSRSSSGQALYMGLNGDGYQRSTSMDDASGQVGRLYLSRSLKLLVYMVYIHVKSFALLQNCKRGHVMCHYRKAQLYRADLSLVLNVPVESEITV